jgi:DNA polymerase-4/protein ImuB
VEPKRFGERRARLDVELLVVAVDVQRDRHRVRAEDGTAISRGVVFREATNDARRMIFGLRAKIERLELDAAAVGVGVTLSGLCSEYAHQTNLWQLGPRRQRELDDAIEQLNVRAGEAQVYRVVEVQPWSRIPERQVALVAYGS